MITIDVMISNPLISFVIFGLAAIAFALILSFVIYGKRKRKKESKINALSEKITNLIIEWTNNYHNENDFINEEYDKLIRNICLNSELCVRVFGYKETFEEKNENTKKNTILYGNMKYGNYNNSQKVLQISYKELYSYVEDYLKFKYDDGEKFAIKAINIDGCRYSDVINVLKNYKNFDSKKNKEYDFLLTQISESDIKFRNAFNKILNSEYGKSIPNTERKNGRESILVVNEMLRQNLINKNEFRGIVNGYYRKLSKIGDELTDKIMLFQTKKSKRFLSEHYYQIFTSLVFKVAQFNSENDRLMTSLDNFKDSGGKDLIKFLVKGGFERRDWVGLLANFVFNNPGEAHNFSILLDDKITLVSRPNSKGFSLSQENLDKIGDNGIDEFIANTFNNQNI